MRETIPWLDLTRQYSGLRSVVLPALDELMARGHFILGPHVEQFEHHFAQALGARHCVGLNSGTSALHLSLLACGVGPEDEVITVAATWISTSWAISYVGARPVFVDIDSASYCMDPGQVEAAITPRTRAILPVHLYGHATDMTSLCAIADRHGLPIIEDACQAHAATLHDRSLGTFGRIGCFSFYPGKNLGAFGEAGAIVTDDGAVADRIRRLRDHAQVQRHVHAEIGFNMRMEGIQGAVLGLKLPHLPAWTAARRRIAGRYEAALGRFSGLRLPREQPSAQCNRHLYPLCCEHRDELREFLARYHIQTAVHYPTPVHLQPAYQHLGYRTGDLPVTEGLCRAEITLPVFPELTDAEVERVIQAVSAWASSREKFGGAAA